MIGGPPVLAVRSVVVRYGGVTAVDDVDIVVDDAEIVAVIGANGAGKTSLFNVICGSVRPERGSVLLDGERIDHLSTHARARLGLVRTFDDARLFERLSLRENLLIARPSRQRGMAAENFADAMLDALELSEYAQTPCRSLPHGAKRLAAIARALCCEPRILLLDEPSAGLDDVESAAMAAVIARICDAWKIPVLLIEHDMNVVMSVSDHVYIMDFGRIIADGTPDGVRHNDDVIAAYLGTASVS